MRLMVDLRSQKIIHNETILILPIHLRQALLGPH